jgi:hypothetical protein
MSSHRNACSSFSQGIRELEPHPLGQYPGLFATAIILLGIWGCCFENDAHGPRRRPATQVKQMM